MDRRELLSLLLFGPLFAPAPRTGGVPPPASARSDELTSLSLHGIRDRLANRQITPTEIVDAYLRRIEELNPALNAFVTVTERRARRDAERLARGPGYYRRPPLLFGAPIAHKDLFETSGVLTTAGSKLFEEHIPRRDAAVVARLATAGSILLGKTNTHELGGGVTTINPFYGTTRNPRDGTRIAGGSSGGSAAAVAGRMVLAATGSDTGGSVRIPAAFCGCVGFKPTFGVIPTEGLLGASPTFDHVGVIARTVEDAALMFEAAAGLPGLKPFEGRGFTPGTRLRIGVPRRYFFDDLQPAVARAFAEALRVFRDAGAEIHDRDLPIDAKTMARVFDPIIVSEIWQRFGADWRTRPESFSKGFAGFFSAPPTPRAELVAARGALADFQGSVDDAFKGVDVFAMPTVPMTAPRIEGPINGMAILRNTWPFNAARTPAIAMPCGFDADGLPIGLQLVARRHDDTTLLRAARTYEREIDWHTRWP